jgi:Caudovirus prohead protease.
MTENSELKSLEAPFSLKSVDEGARTFKGLSSTWDEDLGGDIVHPGAFARTIDHFKSSGRVITLTDGHPQGEGIAGQRATRVIGKVIDAAETKAGVETQFQMVPDDPMAEAALRRIKGGFVTDLSIVYKSVKAEREKGTGRRHIHELKWNGVGLVLQGMNPGARVDQFSVKAIVAAITADDLTDEQKTALQSLSAELKSVLRALLDDPPTPLEPAPVDTPTALAPDDPRRAELSARLRGLKLRRLASVR